MSTASIPGVELPPWSLAPERAVFGIDPSTRRMSVAVLLPVAERGPAFRVHTLSLPQPPDPVRRLALALDELQPWIVGLVAEHAPELVLVEQPFAAAKHVPPASYYVLGVLLAIVGGRGVRVEVTQPSSWKSLALGQGGGRAYKPGECNVPPTKRHRWALPAPGGAELCVKCGASYPVLTWARAAGYEGVLWDEADAIGIAAAGGVLLEREHRA